MHEVKDTKQLGQLVRQTRKIQGLTQEQLSATSGVGIRFIRELEHGKPSCQIAKVLHVMSMLGMAVCIDGNDSK